MASEPKILVLPGSRPDEVSRHLPLFGAALSLLRGKFPGLRAEAAAAPGVAQAVQSGVRGWDVPTTVSSAAERWPGNLYTS